jgi:hypothetical protein
VRLLARDVRRVRARRVLGLILARDAGADRVDRTTMSDDVEVDLVNHPPHYTSHKSGVECIAITEHMNFCLGNALKYIWRADLKNGTQDLEKAAWYIAREIERRKAEGSA